MSILTIEQVFIYNNFIKYESLSNLTQESFKDSSATNVNIFLDMYSMMRDLYIANIEIKDYTIITSCICNLAAHIRKFYLKLGVNSSIYIINSSNDSMNNRLFVVDYNIKFIMTQQVNAKIADMINSNIGMLKMICPYLDRVYFRQGTVETSVMILDMIYKNEASGNMNPNIILSRDIMSFQIPAVNINSCVFMKSGNDLYSVNHTNVLKNFIKKSRKEIGDLSIYDDIFKFPPMILGLLISITNMPSRNVKSLYNIKTASKIIASNPLICNYLSVPSIVYDEISKNDKFNIDRTLFQTRFMALDISYQQRLYMESVESKDMTWFVDLYDPNSLKEINTKYFRNSPIDLEVI